MRKFIIDTDIGSDDAVAIILALKQKDIDILGITTVAGNCSLDHVVPNALMTIEITDKQKPPVYIGASAPIIRDKVDAINVHGEDGMSDCGLIHPTTKPSEEPAVSAILRMVNENPGEVEIVALGPATNIALAIMTDRETMSKVKRIWSMGTGGFGLGNTTPYAEFNVFADPEAYDIMVRSNIPLTIIGFDLNLQSGVSVNEKDIDILLNSKKPEAVFSVESNKGLLEFSLRRSGQRIIFLADAVAMAVALWDEIVLDAPMCYCEVCTNNGPFYGQVAVYPDDRIEFLTVCDSKPKNTVVIRKIDIPKYKEKLLSTICE